MLGGAAAGACDRSGTARIEAQCRRDAAFLRGVSRSRRFLSCVRASFKHGDVPLMRGATRPTDRHKGR
jgi:hypothetical protein